MKIYVYSKCSTCQKALKFLQTKKVVYEVIPIIDNPPTKSELRSMLGYLRAQGKDLRHLFNTSGEAYRSLKIGDHLREGMTETEALDLLAKNGKLIKRPFLIGTKLGTVGFAEQSWIKLLDL